MLRTKFKQDAGGGARATPAASADPSWSAMEAATGAEPAGARARKLVRGGLLARRWTLIWGPALYLVARSILHWRFICSVVCSSHTMP